MLQLELTRNNRTRMRAMTGETRDHFRPARPAPALTTALFGTHKSGAARERELLAGDHTDRERESYFNSCY